jgi:hypothetical protein
MLLFIDSIAAMQKDTSSSDVSASHVGRVRQRRRPNEVSYVLIIFIILDFFLACLAYFPCSATGHALYFLSICRIHTLYRSVFSRKSIIVFLANLFIDVMAMLHTSSSYTKKNYLYFLNEVKLLLLG